MLLKLTIKLFILLILPIKAPMIVIPSHKVGPLRCSLTPNSPSKFVLSYAIEYEHPLGKGNFSSVYRCSKSTKPHKQYAVKLINIANLRQNKLEHLVRTEIQLLMAIKHENVISCKDVYWSDTWCYIFCDFFDRNLEQQIRQTHSLTESPQIQAIIKNIFEGLLYLEKSKIIHRDIKPANVFLKEGKAVVADLGFAKYFNEPFYDIQIGSPPYMAPESLSKGFYSHKSDVWAFGVLLYQLFHGEGPYVRCQDMNELVQKVNTPLSAARLRLDLSVQMKEMILNCLQVDVEKRPSFVQIEETWYFKKLYGGRNLWSSPLRAPLNPINCNSNVRSSCSKEKGRINPIFNRINKLKCEIKRKKDENVAFSSLTYFQKTTTPQKAQTYQRDEPIREYYSNIKSSVIVNNDENEEESATSSNSRASNVYFNDFADENVYHASKFTSRPILKPSASMQKMEFKFQAVRLGGEAEQQMSARLSGKCKGWREKMRISQSPSSNKL